MKIKSSKNLRLWCSLALVPVILSLLIAGYGKYKYDELALTATGDTEDWEPNEREERRIANREVLNVNENEISLNGIDGDSVAPEFLTPEYMEAASAIKMARSGTLESSDDVELTDELMAADDMLEMDGEGNPVIYDVSEGEWLAVIALKLYGNKAYWGYIFDVNRDLLSTPNDVKAGMALYLPNTVYYKIDTTKIESLHRAAEFSARLLKE